MRVLLARPRGFCAGVERAIEIVELAIATYGPPIFVRKEIVHNRFVVEDLRQRGAVFVSELSEVPEGAVAVFSAHGVSPAVRAEAASRGLRVIDATCPLVTKVHDEVRRALERGMELVLVGHAGHEEVVGTMGEAPGRIRLVTTPAEVAALPSGDPLRLMVLTQTTLSTDDTAAVMGEFAGRFPGFSTPPSGDICFATRNRQLAVRMLAKRAPVILVVGARNSSNSIRLREVAAAAGARAHLVDHVGEVDWSWLAGIEAVGVTAGASAPEPVVRELVNVIVRRLGGAVEEVSAVEESVHFNLPEGLGKRAR
jgi:4-hydroxy-3-methylbut-2-enyl diphosphate reductase